MNEEEMKDMRPTSNCGMYEPVPVGKPSKKEIFKALLKAARPLTTRSFTYREAVVLGLVQHDFTPHGQRVKKLGNTVMRVSSFIRSIFRKKSGEPTWPMDDGLLRQRSAMAALQSGVLTDDGGEGGEQGAKVMVAYRSLTGFKDREPICHPHLMALVEHQQKVIDKLYLNQK